MKIAIFILNVVRFIHSTASSAKTFKITFFVLEKFDRITKDFKG